MSRSDWAGWSGFAASGEAAVLTLAGESPWDANSFENPEKIVPRASTVSVQNGTVRLSLAPFSLTHVRVAVSP